MNESTKPISGFGFVVPPERIGGQTIVSNPKTTAPFITGGAAKPPVTIANAQVMPDKSKGIQIIEQRKRQPVTTRKRLP